MTCTFKSIKTSSQYRLATGPMLDEFHPQIAVKAFSGIFRFMQHCSTIWTLSNQTIILLDNPGIELHLDGQRDIKRFLEEKIALTSQVVYVTHSPAMIDAFNLRQVRTVELHGNQTGTKVSNLLSPMPKARTCWSPCGRPLG